MRTERCLAYRVDNGAVKIKISLVVIDMIPDEEIGLLEDVIPWVCKGRVGCSERMKGIRLK